jgi:hypothetical protein
MPINYTRSFLASCLQLCLALFIAGCTPPVKTLVEGQSLAYGKVELIYDGEKIENLQGMGKATGVSVVLLRPDQKKAQNVSIAGSGEFYWKVGPGDYTLISFQYFGRGARHNINIGAKFTVPDSPSSVYIGDLIVTVKNQVHSIGIADRSEEALVRLRKEYPNYPTQTISDLLTVEPPVGSFTAISGVCSAEWGIDCKSHQYGVIPLSPEHQSGSYTKIDTLTPTFKWTPSTRPEVHYDLIVRESVSCEGIGLFKEGLPGEVVVYEENLSQPFYTLQKPLEPDTNYIWSVRLREGNTVSTWSTTGYFVFFVIGSSGSSGDWFRFCTPPTK